MAARTFSLNKTLFNPSLYTSIRKLWYEGVPSDAVHPTQTALARWYGFGPADQKKSFDSSCHSAVHDALLSIGPETYPLPPSPKDYAEELSFAPAIARPFVAEVEGAGPEHAHETALSLVLLLDQMPRNIFRDQQNLIYAHYDRIARSLVRQLLDQPEKRPDRHPEFKGKTVYAPWFYMPYEHSEFLEDHKICLDNYLWLKRLLEEKKDEEGLKYLEQGIQIVHNHTEIVEQFGRYPYRNKWLGRETTKEEQKWIEEGGQTFGS